MPTAEYSWATFTGRIVFNSRSVSGWSRRLETYADNRLALKGEIRGSKSLAESGAEQKQGHDADGIAVPHQSNPTSGRGCYDGAQGRD